MRLTLYFLAHEARTALRSARFRIAAGVYLALCSAPAVVVYLVRLQTATQLGAATYAAEVLTVLPPATALFALLASSDGILRERGQGMWIALTTSATGNAGYLLRRWLALAVIVVGLSLLPLGVACALAFAARAPAPEWTNVVAPWALRVMPVAIAGSALGLGMCTIADGVLAGGVQGLLALLLIPGGLNLLLAAGGRHVDSAAAWIGGDRLAERLQLYLNGRHYGARPAIVASEGGYDALAAAGQWLGAAAIALAIGLAALGVAASFLRRGQRDARPWRIAPTHPLRDFLRLLHRLRQRYSPDPVPDAADRLALVAAVAVLALAAAAFAWRDGRYRDLAAARYAAEVSGWPAPTPPAIVPVRCTLRGAIAAGGQVATRATLDVRNTGGVAVSRLAFLLNPALAVTRLQADRGSATAERRWDRIQVVVAPPLADGDQRRLTFDVAGRPAQVHFNLPAPGLAFFARWRQMQADRIAHDLTDLSASYEVRAVSPRRIELAASDLAPVPRFSSLELAPRGSQTAQVLREKLRREVDLDIDVAVPPRLFLADSCGHHSDAAGLLRGRCRTALDDLALRGARAATAATADPRSPVFALLPQHRALGPAYDESLRTLAAGLPHAWPGAAPPALPVLLEWSPPFDADALDGPASLEPSPLWGDGPQLEIHGALVLVPEGWVARSAPLPAEQVVAELVGATLLARREVVERQQFLFRELVRALVAQRLGIGPSTGAVLAVQRWEVPLLQIALLDARYWGWTTWQQRLAAVAADLTARVGDAAMVRGLDAFLARPGTGTIEELLADLERAGGTSLAGLYRDYFVGTALPELTLAAVEEHRRGAGWVVTGRITNRTSGQAVCPLLLNTDLGTIDTVVRVDGGGDTPFRLLTADRPQSLELDPQQSCHRLRPKVPGGIAEYVGFQEETR